MVYSKNNNYKTQSFSLDNVCYLLSYLKPKQDDIGQYIPLEIIKTLCFCAEGSIYSDEFFSAGQQGIKPQIKLIVDSESYNGETDVLYNDIKYSVYRIYVRQDGYTEIYLTKKLGDGVGRA